MRHAKGLRWVFTAGLAYTAPLLDSATVLAQQPARVPVDQSVTLQWVIALGIIVVIGVSAFLNPKRSHLN